jgi:uncharacterized protein YwgA/O-acetyl-ADP-ribose deacetylase (regulator of RNase III)
MVRVLIGNIFESSAQTLVNTVNTVGIMGKGIALGFRKMFPDMFEDYVRRCQRREVRVGMPYVYRQLVPPHIINFPTKDHWRSSSRLEDITKGLQYLEAHIREWDITSIAVPPLGCGEGRLDWRVVGPTLYRFLSRLSIPVDLYAPFGTPHAELQPEFLDQSSRPAIPVGHVFHVEPAWIALVAILDLVSKERYHWPVGRVAFQKVAYFATEAGIPTGLEYQRGSYGPYAPAVHQVRTKLINNGLIVERKLGRMLATEVGPTYEDAKHAYKSFLQTWETQTQAVADLVLRMNTDYAEIGASARYAAKALRVEHHRQPNEVEVLHYVQDWKKRRREPLQAADVAMAIRRLNTLGWLDVEPSADLPITEEAMLA